MPRAIDRNHLRALLDEGVQLVEVLGADEYREAHLPGAINIPLDELTPRAAGQLDRARPVITYCYDTQCDLSPRAAWRLESLGFQDVYDYAAGKADWMGAGLPIDGTAAKLPVAGRLARKDVVTCALATPVDEIRRMFEQSGWDTAFVVNDEQIVLGRLYPSDVDSEAVPGDATAADVMDPGPSTYRPNVTAVELAKQMREHDLETVPITSSDGRLIGLARRADVEEAAQATDTSLLMRSNP